MVFKMSIVVMMMAAAVMLVKDGEGAPWSGEQRDRHWDHWYHLRLQLHEQQQQQQQHQHQHHLHHQHGLLDHRRERESVQHQAGWSIHEARQQQLLRERQLELEQDMREEMEEIIKDNMLEDFAMQLSLDALGSILRPLRQTPIHHHHPDCVTRTAPATLMRLGLAGHFEYIVCGSGDGAAMHLHFRTLGGTTPSLDRPTTATTTPAADTPTPAQPLCPTVPPTTTTPVPTIPDTTTPDPTTPDPTTPLV